MEIIITDPAIETFFRMARVSLVRAFSRLLRVPIRISDEFYGSTPGEVCSE